MLKIINSCKTILPRTHTRTHIIYGHVWYALFVPYFLAPQFLLSLLEGFVPWKQRSCNEFSQVLPVWGYSGLHPIQRHACPNIHTNPHANIYTYTNTNDYFRSVNVGASSQATVVCSHAKNGGGGLGACARRRAYHPTFTCTESSFSTNDALVVQAYSVPIHLLTPLPMVTA